MQEEMKKVNEQEGQEQMIKESNSDTTVCEEVVASEVEKMEELIEEKIEETVEEQGVINSEEVAVEEEEKTIHFKLPDSHKVQEFMKEWVPKQVKRVKYSLEYVDLIGERLEIKGIDTVNSRRKNKLSKIDYREKLIGFHHEGIHELGNLMVYHAQLLGGSENLEDLKAFTLKIGQIKSDAFMIGAYELVELARVLKAKGESEELNETCNLLGGFIRAYRELLGRMERELSIQGIGEVLEQEEKQLIDLQRLKEFEDEQDFERFKKTIEEAEFGQEIMAQDTTEDREKTESMEAEKIFKEREVAKAADDSQQREVAEEAVGNSNREAIEKVENVYEIEGTEKIEIMTEMQRDQGIEQEETEEDLEQWEEDEKETMIRYIPLHQDK